MRHVFKCWSLLGVMQTLLLLYQRKGNSVVVDAIVQVKFPTTDSLPQRWREDRRRLKQNILLQNTETPLAEGFLVDQGEDDSRWGLRNGFKNGIASGLATSCAKILLHPLDCIKTVQQLSGVERMSLIEAGWFVVQSDGVCGLYRGLGVSLLGSIPSVGIYFFLYEYCMQLWENVPKRVPGTVKILASAAVANIFASYIRVPYEILKQQLQAGTYPSTIVAIKSIYKLGGLGGFFIPGSLAVQWARDVPYAMITLLVYEYLHSILGNKKSKENDGSSEKIPHLNALIGGLAGGISTVITQPMDVVKTRVMTSSNSIGMFATAYKALADDGPFVFIRGLGPRLLHKIPANCIFFLVYETFRTLLRIERVSGTGYNSKHSESVRNSNGSYSSGQDNGSSMFGSSDKKR
eukprot:263019_1